MHLLLIRHGLPVRVENADDGADPGLSDDGHAQARHLAAHLADETVHAVYSSPMRRAYETAVPTAERLGLDIVVEPGIAESDLGASSYIPVEQLKAEGDPRWRQGWTANDWPEEHEPLDVFHARVMAGIEGIIGRHPGQTVAVFCHGGVIGRYTSTILDRPWESMGFFYPFYTSISRIAASRNRDRGIITLNETHHLRGTGLPTGQLA